MTNQNFRAGGQRKPGELLQVVGDRLTARGFRVSRADDPCSRRAKVDVIGVTSPADYPDTEVVVEDDGYVELRYWPPAERPSDPHKIADLIADYLFRNLSDPPGTQP
jgi:hypothetical protein